MKKIALILTLFLSSFVVSAGTPVVAAPVPTLGEWGVIILMISIVILGAVAIRNAYTKKMAKSEKRL